MAEPYIGSAEHTAQLFAKHDAEIEAWYSNAKKEGLTIPENFLAAGWEEMQTHGLSYTDYWLVHLAKAMHADKSVRASDLKVMIRKAGTIFSITQEFDPYIPWPHSRPSITTRQVTDYKTDADVDLRELLDHIYGKDRYGPLWTVWLCQMVLDIEKVVRIMGGETVDGKSLQNFPGRISSAGEMRRYGFSVHFNLPRLDRK